MWKAWRASNWRSAFRLPLSRMEATFWLSEYHTNLVPERRLANYSKAWHTALSFLHVELCAVSAIYQFWWDANSTSGFNWTNAPQAESEASEMVILVGRDLAPQYNLPFKAWTLCLQKSISEMASCVSNTSQSQETALLVTEKRNLVMICATGPSQLERKIISPGMLVTHLTLTRLGCWLGRPRL